MPGKLKASDIMTSPPITVGATTTVSDAARIMIEHRIGCLPVVDDAGNMLGMVTDRAFFPTPSGFGYTSGDVNRLGGMWIGDIGDLDADLKDAVRAARSKPVKEVMTTERVSVREDDAISAVAEVLMNDRIYHVAVVRARKVVGVISRRDLLKVFASAQG